MVPKVKDGTEKIKPAGVFFCLFVCSFFFCLLVCLFVCSKCSLSCRAPYTAIHIVDTSNEPMII